MGQGDGEGVHGVVNFQVEADRAYAELAFRSSGIQSGELFAANDGRRNFVGEKLGFFARPETGEGEYRFADAHFADFLAFGGASDAKPIGAGFLEGFGDFRSAVAVAIAFDNAENFARNGQFFGFGIYEITYGVKIVAESGQ